MLKPVFSEKDRAERFDQLHNSNCLHLNKLNTVESMCALSRNKFSAVSKSGSELSFIEQKLNTKVLLKHCTTDWTKTAYKTDSTYCPFVDSASNNTDTMASDGNTSPMYVHNPLSDLPTGRGLADRPESMQVNPSASMKRRDNSQDQDDHPNSEEGKVVLPLCYV